MKKIIILLLVVFISFGFRIFHKEKYLLKVDREDCSLVVIDHIKTRNSIEINFTAKCDMRIPLNYNYSKNNQYFFSRKGSASSIHFGWDVNSALMDYELKTKFIKKGTQISQSINLIEIDKIEILRFQISYISDPAYVYNDQIEQTASMFWRLMYYFEISVYLK